MAALLDRELGTKTELTPGRTGEFSVWVDGERVLDKDELGGFPQDPQVVEAVRAHLKK